MKLLQRLYLNPFKLLVCCRNEINRKAEIRPGYVLAFRLSFNFLIKFGSLKYSNNQNLLDAPDAISMILSKRPGFLQDKWKRKFAKSGRLKQ